VSYFPHEYTAACGRDSDIAAHLPRLFQVTAGHCQPQVLELGTRRGESTRAFLAAAEERSGHVWSVDIEQPDVPIDRWKASGLWTLTVADDRTWEPPPHYRPDILFIDTSHELRHTLLELRKFVPLVRAGGRVFLHDTEFGWDPPRIPPPGPVWFPVAAALDLYCDETGLRWRNHYGSYGLGEIQVP
jgi:hypothetical protein